MEYNNKTFLKILYGIGLPLYYYLENMRFALIWGEAHELPII